MMKFKKASLSLAMAVALTGGMGAVTTVSAAPTISEHGLGQALIFPYYTVRDGYMSLFNITNTSGSTVAVKVRFRESHNSRDVLDFNLVLSPYDVWTGWLEDSTEGPVLRSDDKSCTAPNMTSGGFLATNVGYSGSYADSTNTSIDRAREGYVEVIMMGHHVGHTGVNDGTTLAGGSFAPTNPTSYYAKHVSGTPRNCTKIADAFDTTKSTSAAAVPTGFATAVNANRDIAGVAAAATAGGTYGVQGSGDPSARADLNDAIPATGFNPLKGNFSLIKAGQGIGGGNTAVAIADFTQYNLVTAQKPPYYNEPTLMAGTGGLWSVDDEVVNLLKRTTMINEWSNNAKTGAKIDWVITMPTKNFYVDYPSMGVNANTGTPDNFQAAMNSARGYVAGNSTAATATGAQTLASAAIGSGSLSQLATIPAFSKAFNSTSAVNFGYTIYDREETTASLSSVVLSPQPPSTAEALKYEVNVLTFDGAQTLNSAVSSNVSVPTSLKTPNGWLSANIGGIPAIGFAFKVRDQGTAGTNYGQILDHGYTATVE